ncbi:hypothetical protein HWV62_32784 [Athelia sp. TMB]|nr:hypothetical protein HWV62_32784 [Athelia sp. TMB]
MTKKTKAEKLQAKAAAAAAGAGPTPGKPKILGAAASGSFQIKPPTKAPVTPAPGPVQKKAAKVPPNPPTPQTLSKNQKKKEKAKQVQALLVQSNAQIGSSAIHQPVQSPYVAPAAPPPQPIREWSAPPGLPLPAPRSVFAPAVPVARLPSPPESSTSRTPISEVMISAGHEEVQLLEDDSLNTRGRSRDHELRTAPIFTRDAYVALGTAGHTTQYGVLGKVLEICRAVFTNAARSSGAETDTPDELSRMYVNTNAPFSAIVCGVQGSGKSHTVSVLLENMFIPSCTPIGGLTKPLCGLVLHFGEGGPASRPCEAAWVGVPTFHGVRTPPVRVFVSRSSLNTMRTVYAPLGDGVSVEPLLFSEAELDAEAFLSMMSVTGSEGAPLYIQIILSILRELGENYTYRQFIFQLEVHKKNFNPAQLAGLEQRMALLQSFMDQGRGTQPRPRFEAGQLTIIDLSDPFIDPASACGLFEIVTRLFVRADVGTGKVLLVDEAHKYLSATKGTTGLTKSLLTLTQPTVVPLVLLDLCTVAILHRFQSPSWWKHLAEHVSADVSAEDAFEKVVGLQTGEAIILAPSGLDAKDGLLRQLGRRYCCVKMRKRVTADGGASILVLE